MSTTSDQEYEQVYRYTSGRWLWDEESQLSERYRKFEVSELQKLAVKSVGAKACSSMIKLAEGGFNEVFPLCMDNGFSRDRTHTELERRIPSYDYHVRSCYYGVCVVTCRTTLR